MNTKKVYFNRRLFATNLFYSLPFILLMAVIYTFICIGALRYRLTVYEYESFQGMEDSMLWDNLITYTLSVPAVRILFVAYSFLCGLLAFHDLYRRQTVYTLHALPLTRLCIYVTLTASGLAALAAPFCITGIAVGIYAICYGYTLSYLLPYLLVMLTSCLIFYALSVLAVMLTGHLLAVPVVYVLLNVAIAAIQMTVHILIELSTFGIDMDTEYDGLYMPYLYLKKNLYFSGYSFGERYNGVHGLLIYAAVSVVLLALGAFLYYFRKPENYGSPIVFGRLKSVLVYLIAVLCAFALTLKIYPAFFGRISFDSEYKYNVVCYDYIPMVSYIVLFVIFLLCSIGCCLVLRMLVFRTVHVLRFGFWGLGGYAAIALMVFAVIRAGGLHISKTIPSQSDISCVRMECNNCISTVYETRSEDIKNLLDIHRQVVNHKESIAKNNHEMYNQPMTYVEDTYTLTLYYQLKDGSSIKRYYHIKDMEDGADIIAQWNDYITDAGFNKRDFEAMQNLVTAPINVVSVYSGIMDEYNEITFSSEDIFTDDCKALLDAVYQDICDGTLKQQKLLSDLTPFSYSDTTYSILIQTDFWHSGEDMFYEDETDITRPMSCNNFHIYTLTNSCVHSYPLVLEMWKNQKRTEIWGSY